MNLPFCDCGYLCKKVVSGGPQYTCIPAISVLCSRAASNEPGFFYAFKEGWAGVSACLFGVESHFLGFCARKCPLTHTHKWEGNTKFSVRTVSAKLSKSETEARMDDGPLCWMTKRLRFVSFFLLAEHYFPGPPPASVLGPDRLTQLIQLKAVGTGVSSGLFCTFYSV